MKKVVIGIFMCVFVIGAVGCSAKQESSTSKPQKLSELIVRNENDPIDFECADGTKLKYAKHELISNRDGKPTVLVYMDFTNNGNKSSSVEQIFSPKIFQNGVECTFDYISEGEMNPELENTTKQIQTGTTIQVAYYFILQNNIDELTLEVSDFANTSEVQKQKLVLQ